MRKQNISGNINRVKHIETKPNEKIANLKISETFSSYRSISGNQKNHQQIVEDLASIKERLKLRNYDKENNEMFRSQFVAEVSKLETTKQETDKKEESVKNQGAVLLQIQGFQIGDLLGRGAKTMTRIVRHTATGSIYSLKTFKKAHVEQNLASFIQALKIQMFLDHPNIAKIYGIIVEKEQVHLLMQYCIDGDLFSSYRSYLKRPEEAKEILSRITLGLSFIHDRRILHRDLKLQNILLCFGVPKITDFELSAYTKLPFFNRKTICGTPAYFSPQMIQKHRYNKMADIWCLGIIYYEVLCGYFPFDATTHEDITKIPEKQIKSPPNHISPLGRQLLLGMLDKDPETRFCLKDVMRHEFVQIEFQRWSGGSNWVPHQQSFKESVLFQLL